MIQPLPTRRHHSPHFQPEQPPDSPQAGELITIPQAALEQASLFQRMLANKEFVAVIDWLEAEELARLAQCKDDAETIRTTHLRWKCKGGLLNELQTFVYGIEQAMEARKAQLAAMAGKADPPPQD